MKIVDLEPADPRIADVLPVLRELRPHLTADLFAQVYDEGYRQGLRFTAVFDDNGRCVGAAGWRVQVNTVSLRALHVDDLVTAESARSTGVGGALLAHLENHARERGCRELTLDSGTARTAAHRFYLRERLDITAFHFVKQLDTP
ncbi:GNAT family N-acetyltransferase [Yinghuangia seranimata]|uniref:GNAT family N-acetyltransferase n=1 Tax=Yinghuangia seranimata TaxID=408067 RepID=UPI00248CAF99|nr:GNAT family N-acetyltransferase [Yinghuangia seranimata]MDI2131858.1 GNAT family N-acetyltransferase [Yinghuangia seranimata]